MDEETSIIIFDGDCPYCKLASVTMGNLNEEIKIIDWQDVCSQRFLEAQFDEKPFSMVFIDVSKNRIWVGEKAAEEIADRSKTTKPFKSVVSGHYDKIASVVGKLSGREQEYDDKYDGIYKVNEEAKPVLEDIYEKAEDFT